MSNQNPQPRIGLILSETEMYAPLRGREKRVDATVRIRDGGVDFDFTVNGQAGTFTGLHLEKSYQAASLMIDNTFIRNYSGTWPVQVEIIASLDAFEDRATLTLYDTRTLRAERVVVAINPDSLKIPTGNEYAQAHVQRQFYDANDIPLPFDEITETLEVVPPVPGVELEGVMISISSMPHADKVNVRVSGPDGVSGDATLTLVK
ncbi:hypothetical protein [Pseudomonas japonica]|uniref:Uncharacterized protein n=1 Tax=Pseudomonas japonica TaxID=256466 RepID=A0A239BY92_9PSED|nr:hypothetical protein [Pseudomonas japonica]SNS12860.1 hypothetical protein SAMN05444352_103267 [Pseudomonas japonica]